MPSHLQNKSKKATSRKGSSIHSKKQEAPRKLQVCTTCTPATEAKYRTRPSPPCHAEDCSGLMLKGNDKRIYLSHPDSRGIYKWVPMITSDEIRFPKSVTNVVYTHDNGSRPFRVTISKGGKQIDIAECIYPEWRKVPFTLNYKPTPGGLKHSGTSVPRHSEAQPEGWAYNRVSTVPKDYEDARYYAHRLTYKVSRVLLGDDPENIYDERPEWVKGWRGNSVLAELAPNRYLYIGESVFELQTSGKSPITMYRSPVGNNDVPYPFAVDSEYVYLIAYDYKIPISEVDFKAKPFDPYVISYNKLTMPKLVKKIIIPRSF